VAFTYLKVKSAKCLLFTSGSLRLVIFGLGLKNLVLFTSLPDPLSGGACYPLPEKYNTRSIAPSASIFGPLGLIRQPLPTVFISPTHKGLDKITGSAHFRSQRMHQNAGNCI